MEKRARGTYTLRRLFPSLDELALKKLERNTSVLRLRRGQNLFIAGDKPRSIYAVANGCMKIVRENADGDSVITRIARPGDIVGIREVFGEFNYGRTSVALKDSEVFSIDAQTTQALIRESSAIALQFMKIFCTELARMERRIESDLYRPARSRVAAVVYELYQIFAVEGELSFEPPLNRREIAELADVTPETVSRSLAEFRSAGLVDARGSVFHIREPMALFNEAEDR